MTFPSIFVTTARHSQYNKQHESLSVSWQTAPVATTRIQCFCSVA